MLIKESHRQVESCSSGRRGTRRREDMRGLSKSRPLEMQGEPCLPSADGCCLADVPLASLFNKWYFSFIKEKAASQSHSETCPRVTD